MLMIYANNNLYMLFYLMCYIFIYIYCVTSYYIFGHFSACFHGFFSKLAVSMSVFVEYINTQLNYVIVLPISIATLSFIDQHQTFRCDYLVTYWPKYDGFYLLERSSVELFRGLN